MAIAITVRSNPGLVTAVSPAENALPSQILVDSLPEGGAVGVDLYYIGGEVKRAADLTDAERETLGLPPAEEEEETGGSSGTASSPWSDDEDGGLESRGVEMGGSGSNAASESGGGQAAEDDRGVTVSGGGTLCRITLPAAEWAARTGGSPHYIFAIANEAITPSTVLQVTGINRDALRRDLLWFSSEGLLTFGTDEPPTEDAVIDCVLIETGDDWQAVGRIDAWPQAAWRSLAYTLDLTKTANNAAVVAANHVKRIQTPLDFSDARLLFATPEWTGGSRISIPNIYLDASGHLCVTLANLGSSAAKIDSLSLRILYTGTLSGLTGAEEQTADETGTVSSLAYITTADIDDIT